MRLPIVVVAAGLVSTRVRADVPAEPAPDLALRWLGSQGDLEASTSIIDITVTGDKVHYKKRASGRGTMPNSSVDIDGGVKDPRALAAAIAVLDKLPTRKHAAHERDGSYYTEICLTRGKRTRCAERHETDPKSLEVDALSAIRDALTAGLKLGPFER